MPPITSPRRTALHAPPALARPMAIPGGGGAGAPVSAHALGTTPSSTGTSPSSMGSFTRPAPIMVALAGWPEPVFVQQDRDTWEKRHSRPPSPTGFRDVRDGISGFPIPSFGHQQQVREFRDGISTSLPTFSHHHGTPPSRLPPLGAERRDGIGADLPAASSATHPAYGVRHGAATSMVRTTSGMAIDTSLRPGAGGSGRSSPLRSSSSPDASPPPHQLSHSHSPSHSMSSSHSYSGNATSGGLSGGSGSHPAPSASSSRDRDAGAGMRQQRRNVHGFPDPRYGPNAPIIGGRRTALRVAPAWTSAGGSGAASSSSAHSASHGHGPHAHSHAHSHGSQPYPSAAGRGGHGHRGIAGMTPAHIQRSVPEVWPPPKTIVQPPHLATAVYPRDPDSPWMWSMGTPSTPHTPHTPRTPRTPRTPHSARSISPIPASPREEVEREERRATEEDKKPSSNGHSHVNGRERQQSGERKSEERMDVDVHGS